MICLENLLDAARVGAFVKVLGDDSLYEAGKRTAGRAARQRKHNLQAIADKPEVTRIVASVREALGQHTLFQRFAVPARIGRVMVSRYEPGMTYGAHFDDAFIDGVRTDLSFTLFLSEPDSYRGGELELYTPMGSQALKLPPGCALVYPSDQLHAVRPVEDGMRLAVVGWVQSRVRAAAQRQLLFELTQATGEVQGAAEGGTGELDTALTQLRLVRNNLLRLWADS